MLRDDDDVMEHIIIHFCKQVKISFAIAHTKLNESEIHFAHNLHLYYYVFTAYGKILFLLLLKLSNKLN